VAEDLAQQYYERAHQLIDEIFVSQSSELEAAGTLVAETIERDRLVYTLGSGHSLTVAAELYFRAGGLANFDIIHDKTFGRAERLTGYAKILMDSYPINSDDLLIIVSNSGRNPLPVEMALEAKQRGIRTIGITSLRHSQAATARNESGHRLFEVCDVVIDNRGVPGDAIVDIGVAEGIRIAPTSTLSGIFISNCIVCVAVQKLMEKGVRPPVFVSANLDAGDECNRPLLQFIRERIRGL